VHRTRPTILIADDHNLMAELCKRLLETEFDVVGTVNDGRALLRAAQELKPQVIVVDIGMPLLNGLDAGEQVKRLLPAVKLVFLTMSTESELAAEAFRRGASAYLVKTCATDELVVAVRNVLRGVSYISPSITRHKIDFLLRQGKPRVRARRRLTERQREVLQLLAEGRSMKEVAAVLGLSARTVAFHKYRIMEALGLKNNAELVQFAVREHIVAA
jgi:DNA-binding NarL/FixJ family response regulator